MNEKLISYIKNYPTGSSADAMVYPRSIHEVEGQIVFMVDNGDADLLVADASLGFAGEKFDVDGKMWVTAPLTHENALHLRKLVPFAAPVSVLRKARSVGVGDRLGIATPGHLRVFEKYDAYPVLAQQSIRELTLTNRNFDHVLDCASFAVFREDYQGGYGADGDHLKTDAEVQMAIDCGYTMITLDCSEHIRNDVDAMSDEAVNAEYVPNAELEAKYIGKTFTVEGQEITFGEMEFKRISLVYNKAIEFAAAIYKKFFSGRDDLDFEVSIDETATPTAPGQHFYVANELIERGVKPATVAPRFCGEFQKGVDYRGDIAQFEN